MTDRPSAAAVGLEVSDLIVRAVLVDATGTQVRSVELRLPDRSDAALALAFAQVAQFAADTDAPTRLAWFPSGTTCQRLEIAGLDEAELDARRTALFEQDEINATALLHGDPDGLLAARWDDHRARQLASLGDAAGLTGMIIEPAPAALARVLPDSATFARRTVDELDAWVMLADRGSTLAATTLPPTRREFPAASIGSASSGAPGTPLDQSAMLAYVSGAVRGPGDLTPSPDLDDVWCVALGAALGALSSSGGVPSDQPFRVLRTDAEIERAPWTVERITDDAPIDETSLWRRITNRLRRGN